MDLRLDIERRKRFAGREREDKRSPGGSRGPSRDRSSEKSGKRHKKSKYVCFISLLLIHQCSHVSIHLAETSDSVCTFKAEGAYIT